MGGGICKKKMTKREYICAGIALSGSISGIIAGGIAGSALWQYLGSFNDRLPQFFYELFHISAPVLAGGTIYLLGARVGMKMADDYHKKSSVKEVDKLENLLRGN